MNNEIISDAEKIRIAAIDDVKARQHSSEEFKLAKRVEEDPSSRRRHDSFLTQCIIDEMLNKFVLFIKNYHDGINESYRITNKSPFYELVEEQDFVDYVMNNIIPTIDNEVIDKNDVERLETKKNERTEIAKRFYGYNIDIMRNFLFLCHSIKPNPIPKFQSDGSIDALDCFAAGINPESFYTKTDKWFLEKQDFSLQNIREIITDGTINGRQIAIKIDPEKKKSKKY